MSYREESYTVDEPVDFSSIFMQTAADDQAASMPMLNDTQQHTATRMSDDAQLLSENRNINNILQQIRDEGAALPRKKNKPVQAAANRSRVGNRQAAAKPANVYTTAAPAAGNTAALHEYADIDKQLADELQAAVAGETEIRRKGSLWQTFALSLAIAVTTVMGYNIYQLNNQALEMQATLEAYEEQIDDLSTGHKKSSDAISKITRLNNELTGLKQDIVEVKTGYSSVNEKLSQAGQRVEAATPDDIAAVKQNIGMLENGLANTQSEISQIKAAVAQVKKGVEARPAVSQRVSQPVGRWVVNLASLSSKAQADVGVARLQSAGIEPRILETTVKGKKVYRLSVEGFNTRNEAVQFANKASKQYGFEGGWVWQS